MKINRGRITITELPGGARIERLEDGRVLIEGLDGAFTTAETQEIRDALNIFIGEDANRQYMRENYSIRSET